jgi:hypothetical protein
LRPIERNGDPFKAEDPSPRAGVFCVLGSGGTT